MTGLTPSFFGDDDRVKVSLRSVFDRSSEPGDCPFGSDAFGVCVTRIAVRLGSLLPRRDDVAFSAELIALWPGTAVVEDRRELLSIIEEDLRESDATGMERIEPVDPRRAASSGEMVLIALSGIFTVCPLPPPDSGLGVGSTAKPGVSSPRFILLFFLFF